jgi:hypothetical protein
VFLTSRPDIPIRYGIGRIPRSNHEVFVLHNVPSTTINRDISIFLEYNLGHLRQDWDAGMTWPGEVVLRRLVHQSSGLFIWAATACRFIIEGEEFADERLVEVLEGISSKGTPEQYLD